VLIVEWSDKRPDDLAAALVELMKNKSPIIRRGAARLVGTAVRKTKLAEHGKPGEIVSLPERSKAAGIWKSAKPGTSLKV
jgi:hypothetical protein